MMYFIMKFLSWSHAVTLYVTQQNKHTDIVKHQLKVCDLVNIAP